MNWITFDEEQGDEFDANFISKANETGQFVDYYVQRLISIAIGDESDPKNGPIWNVYINDIEEDWMEIMRNNRIVCKEDSILWRYHKKV